MKNRDRGKEHVGQLDDSVDKGFAPKPQDLSSIPGTGTVDRKKGQVPSRLSFSQIECQGQTARFS